MKKTASKAAAPHAKARFKVKVVYGFLSQLRIVLLGERLEGELQVGQAMQLKLSEQTDLGDWTVVEILNMDFINHLENPNFLGLVVECKDEAAFKLLQALRVYEEEVFLA